MGEICRVMTLTPWSRGDGTFCFGLKIIDAQHIAEELKEIDQSSVTVKGHFPGSPELMTKCNITETFTTTCPHLGNIDIAHFIEEHGKGQYGAIVIVDHEVLTIEIINKTAV